jgi:integrase
MSIRKRGKGYQVRVAPFAAKTMPTKESAEMLELDLKLRKARGETFLVDSNLLGEELEGFLNRLKATAGLRPRSIEFYEQKAKVWKPLGAVRVSGLGRAQVEDLIVARAAEHPRSAKDELEFLKRVLRDARGRGQRIDDAILEIRSIRSPAKRGRALDVGELYELAVWFPEYAKRLVLLAGQIGARQAVWFEMTEDLLDLKARALTIPADLAKNKREHRVYLTSIEVGLFREQLLARPAGATLVFPTAAGKAWNRSRFGEVWRECREAAALHGRSQTGAGTSVYDGFNFHLLRHTAGSLMALAGMDPAVASERMGHSDGGALFLKTYRHLYEGEKLTQAAKLDALIRETLDENGTEAQGRAANPHQTGVSAMGAPGIEPGTSRV